jgi:hypothetical protein
MADVMMLRAMNDDGNDDKMPMPDCLMVPISMAVRMLMPSA